MLRKWYRCLMVVTILVFLSVGDLLYVSDVDAGKKIFVCYCGRTCECHFEANKFGKCVCGDNLSPSDRRPAESSEYVCGCGSKCLCGSKSDKEGDCVCGKPMKKAE